MTDRLRIDLQGERSDSNWEWCYHTRPITDTELRERVHDYIREKVSDHEFEMAVRQVGYVKLPISDVQNLLNDMIAALKAATVIGQRSCTPGDGLNYGNHDHLIERANQILTALDKGAGDMADVGAEQE